MDGGMEPAVVAKLVAIAALPQLAGFLLTWFVRRATPVSWAAAAVAVWSALWYVWMWRPMQAHAEQSHCGTGQIGVLIFLLLGLTLNVMGGLAFASLVRRLRSAR
jgi:hypothetical protein